MGPGLERVADVASELRRRARAIETEHGATTSVVVRFSADPIGETAEVATTLGADLVLYGPGHGRRRARQDRHGE